MLDSVRPDWSPVERTTGRLVAVASPEVNCWVAFYYIDCCSTMIRLPSNTNDEQNREIYEIMKRRTIENKNGDNQEEESIDKISLSRLPQSIKQYLSDLLV